MCEKMETFRWLVKGKNALLLGQISSEMKEKIDRIDLLSSKYLKVKLKVSLALRVVHCIVLFPASLLNRNAAIYHWKGQLPLRQNSRAG